MRLLRLGRFVVFGLGIIFSMTLLLALLACAGPAEEEATPGPTETPAGVAATATPEEVTPTPEVGKPKYGGVLRITGSDPKYWDPHTVTGGYKAASSWAYVYQTLLYKDPFDPQRDQNLPYVWFWSPDLAESWEMPDETTYIFHLRKGVKWQNLPPVNGREVTAEDVEYSFERILTIEGPGKTWQGLAYITGVEAIDKYTFKITLSRPYSIFLDMNEYYHTKIAPKEAIEAMGGSLTEEVGAKWEGTVGSGPFILDSYMVDSVVKFRRNPDYFKKDSYGNQIPYIDEVHLYVIPDASTSLAALRAGQLDVRGISQLSEYESMKSTNPELKVSEYGSTALTGMGFVGAASVISFHTPNPPFSDIRVRRAVALGFNREEMAETYWGGQEAVLKYWPIPPDYGEGWYVPIDELGPGASYYEYDPEEAKRLLAEAGYPDGFETTLTLTTGYGRSYAEYAELFADYMSKIGIECTIKNLEYGAFYNKWLRYVPEGMCLGSYGLNAPWPLPYWGGEDLGPEFGAWNRSWVNDPKVNELIDEYLRSFDLETQQECVREFQKHVADKVYYVALPHPYGWRFTQPWIKNYGDYRGLSMDASVAPYIWIDKGE